MAASFSYGRLNGRLVHVGGLDPAEHRGLRCGCVCPECGRQLQAHMGRKQSWHFQHHAEDANCNPQPMTLLHAFVRDELARRSSLKVPAISANFEVVIEGQVLSGSSILPGVSYRFASGRAEARAGNIQPDVSFVSEDGTKLALEVRYTHAVDATKQAAFNGRFAWALEFNVSDLPGGSIGVLYL